MRRISTIIESISRFRATYAWARKQAAKFKSNGYSYNLSQAVIGEWPARQTLQRKVDDAKRQNRASAGLRVENEKLAA